MIIVVETKLCNDDGTLVMEDKTVKVLHDEHYANNIDVHQATIIRSEISEAFHRGLVKAKQ